MAHLAFLFDLVINLERGLLLASGALLVGLALLLRAVNTWHDAGFGPLDQFLRQHSRDAATMNLIEHIHTGYIHRRRTQALSQHLSALIPQYVRVLDVGSGDGLLSYQISETRPDVQIMGLDVLIRSQHYIAVAQFDGHTIPHNNRSFDVVMLVDVLRHGVTLPYNYWPQNRWFEAFQQLGLTVAVWKKDLKLYPRLLDVAFGRSLHFIARLDLKLNF